MKITTQQSGLRYLGCFAILLLSLLNSFRTTAQINSDNVGISGTLNGITLSYSNISPSGSVTVYTMIETPCGNNYDTAQWLFYHPPANNAAVTYRLNFSQPVNNIKLVVNGLNSESYTFTTNGGSSTLTGDQLCGGTSIYQTTISGDGSGIVTLTSSSNYTTIYITAASSYATSAGSTLAVISSSVTPPCTTPATPSITTTAATCTAASTHSISNYSSSNTYTFSPAGPTVNTNGVISGATAGTAYTVTAASGACVSPASGAFTPSAATAPDAPSSLYVNSQPTCQNPNGTIIISGNYNSSYTYNVTPSAGTSVSAYVITAPAGTYTVTASNGGCTSAASAPITLDAATNCCSANAGTTTIH